MIFPIVLAVMAFVAAAAVLLPLWRKPDEQLSDPATTDQLRRLQELDDDLGAGDVDPDIAPTMRRELERAVLDAVDSGPPEPAQARHGRGVVFACAALVPILAAALYLELGQLHIGRFSAANPQADLADPQVDIELLLEQVRRRVADEPQDRAAWNVLARTELQLGRYEQAVAAAEQLVALDPDNVDAKLLLVDAISMHEGGALGPRALALIEDVLIREPDNITALIVHGIARAQDGDSMQARRLWQRALELLPPEAPIRADVQRLLGSPETTPSGAASVIATVTLSPSLDKAIAADAPVFIFARAGDGPPAPLAVIRHQFADLPVTVTLDDSQAMMPGHNISSYDSIYVVARIALSGGPQASPGDLEGRSAAFAPTTAASIEIVIDQIVP